MPAMTDDPERPNLMATSAEDEEINIMVDKNRIRKVRLSRSMLSASSAWLKEVLVGW
jgi:hypothetical protein